jgi:L-lactate dehydrogenase complex protein LldG
MNTTRDELLARVRTQPLAPVALPDLPASLAAATAPGSALERFRAALERMGGRWAEPPADGDVDALVLGLFPQASVICSAAPDVHGTRALDLEAAPAALDDVDVGIVRARFGVAETGSVLLTEAELGEPSLGFLSQHLVVLLDPASIVADMHAAYADACVAAARYAIFMTGPSATADIEGVLIHGAQGVRSLTVVPLPRGRA